MRTPEEITAYNKAKVQAVMDRFEPLPEPTTDLTKSQDSKPEEKKEAYWTSEDLGKFKEDLFKGIDDGTLSEDDVNKAQEDLLSLKRETRTIDGKELVVFVKDDLEKGGGEGSRGGHITGHTKAGKPIYGDAASKTGGKKEGPSSSSLPTASERKEEAIGKIEKVLDKLKSGKWKGDYQDFLQELHDSGVDSETLSYTWAEDLLDEAEEHIEANNKE